MNKLFMIGTMVLALGVTACTSTFLVQKDGRGYFVGSNSDAIHKMLCESGDLVKVLSDTKLPQDMRDELYKYNCSLERSGAKVKEIYTAMSPDQRKDLRTAFRHNGFEINHMHC